jgi:hypothetical protein
MKRLRHLLITLALTPALSSCGAACLSTPLAEIHDPAGVTFKVIRTDCDTLAKDSAVSVIATRDGSTKSALLLKYDPWGDQVPQVHIAAPGTVFIHLDSASSIVEQHQVWDSFQVKVAIDRLAYSNRR